MGLLVLSRQHPRQAPFDRWLGDAVREARLFTSPERVEGYARQGFADIVAFDDYEHTSRVELAAVQLARRWPIERVIATSETDILRAGRIRSYLGLPGQGAASARAFRDKLHMKQWLVGHTKLVRIPDFSAVEEGFDVIAFIARHGFPVIVKPVDGFGSVGATAIHDEADLERVLAQRIGRGLEVERFIHGAQYHVDGLILDGELVACRSSAYLGNCLSYTHGGITASYLLAEDNPRNARHCAAAKEILAILPTPASTSFHLELFETADGELYFCEVASRTGGNLINATLEQAFGLNFTELFVRAQAGQALDVAALRARAAQPRGLFGNGLVPPEAGVFEGYREERPALPFVRSLEWTMAKGARSSGPTSSGDRVAGFIVAADAEPAMIEHLYAAWQWTRANAIWTAT